MTGARGTLCALNPKEMTMTLSVFLPLLQALLALPMGFTAPVGMATRGGRGLLVTG
jgi:hypothetical protein